MNQILIDLTPMLPGGANGGAKIMTLLLIKHMAKLAPNTQFILIIHKRNLTELSSTFRQLPNVIINVTEVTIISSIFNKITNNKIIKLLLRNKFKIINNILPFFLKKRLKPLYFKIRNLFFIKKNISPPYDLLFCPFTAPFFHNPQVPTVSLIYDLQFYYYPFFFTKEEYTERKQHFKIACNLSNKIICISDFVKKTVLDNSNLSPNKVATIHIKTAHRLILSPLKKQNGVLKKYQLNKGKFLLYPANFWTHKNHTLLLIAFALYRARNPKSDLKLICTGSDHPNKMHLQKAIKKMELTKWVVLPGYLSNLEFSSLMNGCLAVIFPSLYEGFGMPVIEAMAAGKPVLCSNVTSLPEITQNAALLFDPRKPDAIVKAIERIENEPELVNQLIEQGKKCANNFSNEEEMAKQYLKIFSEVINSKKSSTIKSNDVSTSLAISVITPSYNQGQFIERTIQSVLSQKISNLEYFIVDGGSSDNTVSLLKKYNSLIHWVSEPDRGQAHAVNKGLRQTSGEIIGWLNSDDIYYAGAIETVLQFFKDHPEIDVVYGNAYHIDTNDQFIESYYTEHFDIDRLKEICYLCQPAVFFRRKLIDQYGMLNENLQYCMDYEYWIRLAYNGARFAYIPKLLAGSRLYFETKTLGSRVKVHEEINNMMRQAFKRVPDRWLSNYAHALIESLYNRNQKPHQFKKDVAFQTIKASFRWNKGISRPLLKTSLLWLREGYFLKENVV